MESGPQKTIVFRGFGKAMPLRRRMMAGSTQMDCDAAKATIVPIGTSSDQNSNIVSIL